MEPGPIQALKQRSERSLLALHWSSLIAMVGLVIFLANRDDSYLVLVGLVPVAALALLGQGRPVRAPDLWFRRGALVAYTSLLAFHLKEWILLILIAGILVDGIRSWRNLNDRRLEVEGHM